MGGAGITMKHVWQVCQYCRPDSVNLTTKIFLYTADINTKSPYLVCTKGFYTKVLKSTGFYWEVIIPALFTTEAFTGSQKAKEDHQQQQTILTIATCSMKNTPHVCSARTYAGYAALPKFDHHMPAVRQSIATSCLPGTQHQTCSSRMGQTDGRHMHRPCSAHCVLFCSLAVLDLRVGHTMDVLSYCVGSANNECIRGNSTRH